jgi:hypothetical protein
MWSDDTPIFQVSGSGHAKLRQALELAVGDHVTVQGWATTDDRIGLFWTESNDMIPFPAPMKVGDCALFMCSWLDSGNVDFGKPLDHDGDSDKGWLLFTEGWGHVDPWGYQCFIAVTPRWQHFGK